MKIAISIFIICVFIATELSAQTTLLDSVKIKLASDTEAYKQFTELGKCHCLDMLLEQNKTITKSRKEYSFFYNHFFTLYDLVYAIPRLFRKEKIFSAVDNYYNANIDALFKTLKKRDEKLKLSFHSPLLFCERLFAQNDMTKQAYIDLIQDTSSYNNPVLHKYDHESYIKGVFSEE